MQIEIHQDVDDLLVTMNKIKASVVFGGYLRNTYVGLPSSDVDIATNIPIDIIEKQFGHMEKALRRKTTSGHDVFSFKMNKTQKMFIEIVCTDEALITKADQADYKINSLIYDGNKVIDSKGCLNDMLNNRIDAVDINIINNDLNVRPYLWLKTIRLTSELGFNLSNDVMKSLKKHVHVLNNVSDEIMQTEGHKTLNGKGIITAIRYLHDFGFIPSYKLTVLYEDLFKTHIQPHQKLAMLAILINKNVADEFIQFYRFSNSIKEKYEELYEAYFNEERPCNRLKHQIITIKKIIG